MTPAERKLQREWYAKLKASGFEDIETGDEHDGLLKTDKRIEEGRGEEYQASAEYYRCAGVFLHHRHWRDQRERLIWELHSEGVGMNEIARRARAGNTLVHATINRLRDEMLAPGNEGNKARNGRALWRWLEREAKKLSDEDLIAMAPTFLELARPSTPKPCSTKS
jgi:hypothetical protein